MKVLLISNQAMSEGIVGNPIMLRMRDATLSDSRIEEVLMLRCKKPFSVFGELRKKAKYADVVQIHFGGTYALVVRLMLIGIKTPIFITFHGTDIHAKAIKSAKSFKEKFRIKLNQISSFISIPLFKRCGFVAKEMIDYVPGIIKLFCKHKFFIHPLGVDYNRFAPIDKHEAQKMLGIKDGKYILFSDVHNATIKRRDLAIAIAEKLPEYELLIMCGVQPNNVPLYVNACDFVLLTSDEEGSPNIIREALSLNKPVFSVEVGDASLQLKGLENSCIISRDPSDAAIVIKDYLSKDYVDNTRVNRQSTLDFSKCNENIINMYVQLN